MTIVATAIPKITDEFHGLDLVGWYGSAFFLTVGAFQSGKLSCLFKIPVLETKLPAQEGLPGSLVFQLLVL